jgi:hypothetical protein
MICIYHEVLHVKIRLTFLFIFFPFRLLLLLFIKSIKVTMSKQFFAFVFYILTLYTQSVIITLKTVMSVTYRLLSLLRDLIYFPFSTFLFTNVFMSNCVCLFMRLRMNFSFLSLGFYLFFSVYFILFLKKAGINVVVWKQNEILHVKKC